MPHSIATWSRRSIRKPAVAVAASNSLLSALAESNSSSRRQRRLVAAARPPPPPPLLPLGAQRRRLILGNNNAGNSRRTLSPTKAAQADVLLPLGLDFLTFLAATVLVVPVFKSAKVSPVLGFLFSGLILGELGLFRNTEELEKLSELGVLFLLFEMGLELSFDRLRSLAKYAFGLGTVTMFVTTMLFAFMGLPIGEGLGTEILVRFFHADRELVSIRTLDEAVVIGAALSLSSSAFVLQLLGEQNQLQTKFGSATLGILLLQDIAVVPFLVLLPLIERFSDDPTAASAEGAATLLASLAPTAAKTLLGLGALLLSGRFLLRRIFELVAEARSDETFVALCLLSVTGASLATQRLGFSDTLGAFSAGVLLAETNYRAQVEADIRPFRGILLGLFFVTTGASLDIGLLIKDWQIVVALLTGLLAVKVGTIGTFAPLFGLSKGESARAAFSLAQGGEFAFVLLQLAKELNVLPDELNRLLIIVVVLSMALTPGLVEVGRRVGDSYDEAERQAAAAASLAEGGLGATMSSDSDDEGGGGGRGGHGGASSRPVVICGFGELGQLVANALESPLLSAPQGGLSAAGGGGMTTMMVESVGNVDGNDATTPAKQQKMRARKKRKPPYVAFDLNPSRVRAARAAGFNVTYGDGSRGSVLEAAGAKQPSAIVIAYTARARAVSATRSLREAFGPSVPIFARALDSLHAAELKYAGATDVVTANVESGLELTARVLGGGGGGAGGGAGTDLDGAGRGVAGLPTLSAGALAFLTALLRSQMDARTTQMAAQMMSKEGKEAAGLKQQRAAAAAAPPAASSPSSSSTASTSSSASSPSPALKKQAAAAPAAGAKYDSSIFRLDAGGSASGNASDAEAAATAATQTDSSAKS